MFLRRWWQQYVPHHLVGLDISSDAIKLLKIHVNTSSATVNNLAIVPLPAGAIVKNEIKNYAVVANILKDLFTQPGIESDYIAIAIPRSSAIIKNVTIDSRLNAAEIESRAWVEANRNFPELVGDIYLDFSVLGPSTQGESQLDLILVACRKEQINPYLELFHQSNVTAKIVDINCYALERALALIEPPSQEAVALLNLNYSLSSLIVTHENRLIYAHDHSYDGYRLISQLKKHCHQEETSILTPIEKTGELLDDATYVEILKENLISHLRHTMHFFYSSRPNINIHKMLLSGDCAIIPHLAEFIQQETRIETHIANPFTKMTLAPHVDEEKLKIYAPTLMLCCGLSLSTLNTSNTLNSFNQT